MPQDPHGRIVQSWAVATMTGETNDYSVCTTWLIVKADHHLIDVFRARPQYPDLRRKLASLAKKHGAETIPIENAEPGMTLLRDLQSQLRACAHHHSSCAAGHTKLPHVRRLEKHRKRTRSTAPSRNWATLRSVGHLHGRGGSGGLEPDGPRSVVLLLNFLTAAAVARPGRGTTLPGPRYGISSRFSGNRGRSRMHEVHYERARAYKGDNSHDYLLLCGAFPYALDNHNYMAPFPWLRQASLMWERPAAHGPDRIRPSATVRKSAPSGQLVGS